MKKISIKLKNCYGIRLLETSFDFSQRSAVAIYAPNGVMKSSLANTFSDIENSRESKDRIFSQRKTERSVSDEDGDEISSESVLVVHPYDEDLSVSEHTSTLLLDSKLKSEYEDIIRSANELRKALLEGVAQQSGSKQDIASVISSSIMPGPDRVDDALMRVRAEVEDLKDAAFSDIKYDIIFNSKVEDALSDAELSGSIEEYAQRYNELLESSTFFKKGTFDYYNAGQIAKSLSDNGFFTASHSVNLRSADSNKEVQSKEELEKIIAAEKDAILSDVELRARFERVAKLVQKNRELRAFFSYIQDNEDILSRLSNPAQLKQDIVKSYLKAHESQYLAWIEKNESARRRRREIEAEAEKQRTQWENVVEIFNSRFFVPFRLILKNKTDVLLGRAPIINLGFSYVDGDDSVDINREQLLTALSTGERRALYILNVIFEIQSRIKDEQSTLLVVDDIADSFDYRNKYAIIEYLKEIAENDLFKVVLLTHNFDFFRTVEGRFVGYSGCFMASKSADRVNVMRASGIRNVFAKDWRENFYRDDAKKVASIAFLRNLIEMSKGEDDNNYLKLTSLLHIKEDTYGIKVEDVDAIFLEICGIQGQSDNRDIPFVDLIFSEADKSAESGIGLGLENKVVVAIAIRLHAESYMRDRLRGKFNVSDIKNNQTARMIKEFNFHFPDSRGDARILDRVAIVTPENIHINSFMYEPIIDMGDDHLKNLLLDVRKLGS